MFKALRVMIGGTLLVAGLVGCDSKSTGGGEGRSGEAAAHVAEPDDVIEHYCATHGPVAVGVRHDADGMPLELRVGDGPWTPAVDESGVEQFPMCPECGKRVFVKQGSIDLTRFTVTWRCEACDHTVEDHPAKGPKTCPGCGEDTFWSTVTFRCTEHGEVAIAQQYDDEGRIVEVRVGADGAWGPEIDPATGKLRRVCPECGKPLLPPGM